MRLIIQLAIAVMMLFCATSGAYGLSLELSQELLNRGKNYLIGDTVYPDSAIICLRKLTESYRPELPLKQREICGTAANNLGFTYYQYKQDYKSAYETLLVAKEICDGTDRALTKVNVCINLGNLYSVFAEHVGSPELESEAVKMYREAFSEAYKNRLWSLMLYSFCDLTELNQDLDHVGEQEDILNKFASADIPNDTPLRQYANLRYKALKEYLAGNLELSTRYMVESIANVDDSITPYPWRAQAINLSASLYLKRNMPDSALFFINKLLDDTFGDWSSEVRANAYKSLRKIYLHTGEDDKAQMAYGHLLMIQDSLMNVNQLGTIDDLKFIHELAAERYNSAVKLAEADRQKKVRELIIFFAGLLLVIAIPLLIVIINRHRRLQASYQNLYNRSQRILEQEEINRKLREESFEDNTSDKESTADKHPGAMRILAVLDKTEEVFDPEFSLDRLSELTDIRPRTLSAILNEQLNTSFRDLINRYRVREACKKLSDIANFGQYTIEAISQSVGYKSRTSLVSAFKKETGLTPSEYQRIARQKNI